MPTHPKVARVLFDEAHSEAWTIRSEVAERVQPAHPSDSSYAAAASVLAEREFDVAVNLEGKLTPDLLADVDVLVIAHPSDPKCEATVGTGTRVLKRSEIDAVETFVRGGGGLIALGETEQDKYENNLNGLLRRFGIEVATCMVQDYEHHRQAPSWVLAELDRSRDGERTDLLVRVDDICFYRAGTLTLGGGARAIAGTHGSATPAASPLAAVTAIDDGRVASLADSDLFGEDCLGDVSNRELLLNLVYWTAEPAFRADDTTVASPAREDPAWAELRDAVADLRPTQQADGSVDTAAHDPGRLAELTGRIAHAAHALRPHFPTRAGTSTPSFGISTTGRPTASASPTSPARSRPSVPSGTAATASSTSSCSRCTSTTPRATSASRR
jgi:hypothetical protein